MDSKLPFSNGKSAEVGIADGSMSEEHGPDDTANGTIKRDLRRRHINMIAIAGMIVSEIRHALLIYRNYKLTTERELVSSSHPDKPSLAPALWVPCLDISSWD